MPSPFPGMDPFLEAGGFWRDFHLRFLAACGDQLAERLPDNYVTRYEERSYLLETATDPEQSYFPDLAIERERQLLQRPAALAGLLTLEPVTIPHLRVRTEEIRERWLEIRRGPDWDLVTAVELLSPTNKVGDGRGKYLEKRLDFLEGSVHLVELDLLLGGQRLPLARPLPSGDYFALVTRTERRPLCDVYAWSIRQGLPAIPIPLKGPDPDIPLDLAAAFSTIYERGRYARSLPYAGPLPLLGDPDDRIWAEGIARQAVRNR